MAKFTNEELLQQARNGNMEPLLGKLRSGGVGTSAGTGGIVGNDGGVEDNLWYMVLAADMDGELTPEQMAQCRAAVTGS